MAVRVLTDFHHSSLLRATNMLFGDRLGMDVYRPIGMEWFDEGFWAINDQRDTAEQFLRMESQPIDETPALNELASAARRAERFNIYDPGNSTTHRACTLDFFKHMQFDYVIASIPAHVALFERLIAKYQPAAKLIVQIGNEWPESLFAGHNVLASIRPRAFSRTNAMFYHQEFDTEIFRPTPVPNNKTVYSFINILQNMALAWSDFQNLEMFLQRRAGFVFKSFGGQCRDGNMNGPVELADKMREASMIFHVKEGGDGFGHIIYNAYAVGRPIITRSHHYAGRLAEELLVPGTFIDLDKLNLSDAINMIDRISQNPDELIRMGAAASARFREVVDYGKESEEIGKWLSQL